MRLFLVPDNKCQHITEIIPGIFAVSQMEQTFHPYLDIEYLPARENEPPGIILQTKSGNIRRNYTFKTPKDIEDLRNLIWKHLVKDYNIKDITVNGCLKDFRKYNPNKVVQGWQAMKRLRKNDMCCLIIISRLTSAVLRHNILHEVYRLSTKDEQTREICKKVRWEECGNNYPPNTPTFQRCVNEVDVLCTLGYPINQLKVKKDAYIKKVQNELYDYLLKNDMKVDKKKFDEIISAGLFDDLGNRMGNKVANYQMINKHLHDIFKQKGYYRDLIEMFYGKPSENNNTDNTDNTTWRIILLICILVGVYYYLKKY